MDKITDIWSDRTAALRSQHFLTMVSIKIAFQKCAGTKQKRHGNIQTVVNDNKTNQLYGAEFLKHMELLGTGSNLNDHVENVNQSMQIAATAIENPMPQRKRPWISDATLNMIAHKEYARSHGQYDTENNLHK